MVVEGTRGTNTAMAAMDEAVAAMRLSRVGERESYPQLRCFDFCVITVEVLGLDLFIIGLSYSLLAGLLTEPHWRARHVEE